jgi:Ca-activated chloride channel family protein
MKDYAFHDPLWLLALLILPLLVWVRGRRGAPVLVVPFAAAWHRPSLLPTSRWPAALAMTGLVLLIGALARPQIVEDKREVKQQGYDLMLAIDLSGSMLAEDYERGGERINRLQAIKPIIQAFISQRTSDRIGMVVFSGRAYTLAPLTFDHDWLGRQIERLKLGMIEDGTAIGDGLGVALTRLEQAQRAEGGKRKGAFVVLMTDGANNRGTLTPEQSTEIAKSRGVPVYTIGAGRDGLVPMPVFDDAGRRLGTRRVISGLDESQLRAISDATGGRFFPRLRHRHRRESLRRHRSGEENRVYRQVLPAHDRAVPLAGCPRRRAAVPRRPGRPAAGAAVPPQACGVRHMMPNFHSPHLLWLLVPLVLLFSWELARHTARAAANVAEDRPRLGRCLRRGPGGQAYDRRESPASLALVRSGPVRRRPRPSAVGCGRGAGL